MNKSARTVKPFLILIIVGKCLFTDHCSFFSAHPATGVCLCQGNGVCRRCLLPARGKQPETALISPSSSIEMATMVQHEDVQGIL